MYKKSMCAIKIIGLTGCAATMATAFTTIATSCGGDSRLTLAEVVGSNVLFLPDIRSDAEVGLIFSYAFEQSDQLMTTLGQRITTIIPGQKDDCPLTFHDAYYRYRNATTADDLMTYAMYKEEIATILGGPTFWHYSYDTTNPDFPLVIYTVSLNTNQKPDASVDPIAYEAWFALEKYIIPNTTITVNLIDSDDQ